jgi:hypothetical protein
MLSGENVSLTILCPFSSAPSCEIERVLGHYNYQLRSDLLSAVTVGGGYIWEDVFNFAVDHGYIVVGGDERVCIIYTYHGFILHTARLL